MAAGAGCYSFVVELRTQKRATSTGPRRTKDNADRIRTLAGVFVSSSGREPSCRERRLPALPPTAGTTICYPRPSACGGTGRSFIATFRYWRRAVAENTCRLRTGHGNRESAGKNCARESAGPARLRWFHPSTNATHLAILGNRGRKLI